MGQAESGNSEVFGNDFLVSLRVGVPGPNNDFEDDANAFSNISGTPFDVEWADIQAGTFMHELGHTLGLRHGGSDEIQCKPNYLSVMSYARQFNEVGLATNLPPPIIAGSRVRINRRLDYSTTFGGNPLPTLIETALFESNGIGGPAGQRTLFGSGITGARRVGPSTGGVDWNGINGIEVAPINNADINFITNLSPSSAGETLNSYDDWSNIQLNFRNSQDFSDGVSQTAPTKGPELNVTQALDGFLGGTDYDDDGVLNASDNCPLIFNPDQADKNANGIGDACDGISADLSLTITDSLDPLQCSDSLTYSITVSNTGPNSAEGVIVTDELPSAVSFASANTTQGSCNGSICALGTLASGASATITIVVTPATGGTIVNMAGVGLNTTDPNLDNNSSTATTVITGYSISPTSAFFPGTGSGSVNVTAPGACSWTTLSNDDWIVLTSADSEIGNGLVTYELRQNFTGEARFGTLTIAGQTFSVLQNTTGCAYEILPLGATVSGSGGTGSISLTTSTHCGWQPVSDVNWMTITSANMGIGNAIVAYSVAPNPGPKGRKGTITIGGKIFSMKQTFP